ncbi:MAG: hypothetical protein LBD55_07860 [Treponema sp.]|jgi:hypothetical protein|nr:hypothetical protein [Treponema sp.]
MEHGLKTIDEGPVLIKYGKVGEKNIGELDWSKKKQRITGPFALGFVYATKYKSLRRLPGYANSLYTSGMLCEIPPKLYGIVKRTGEPTGDIKYIVNKG